MWGFILLNALFMKYSLHCDHLELSEWDKEQLIEKLGRIDKFVDEAHMLDVVFKHSTHHQTGDVVTCTLNLEQGKRVFHASRASSTAQTALDEALHALRQELEHAHGKRETKARRAS